jgi:hypothetical protein
MAWPAARKDHQDIIALRQTGVFAMLCQPEIARGMDAPLAVVADRIDAGLFVAPCLDLDEGQDLALPRDDIHFAQPGAVAEGEDAVALHKEVGGSYKFGGPAASLRPAATG